jgi:hypothetical protein
MNKPVKVIVKVVPSVAGLVVCSTVAFLSGMVGAKMYCDAQAFVDEQEAKKTQE